MSATWQDLVFGAGQLAFALALLPSIFGRDKPAAATSALTAATLLAFTVAYATLDLMWASASCSLCAAAWLLLLLQKLEPLPLGFLEWLARSISRRPEVWVPCLLVGGLVFGVLFAFAAASDALGLFK